MLLMITKKGRILARKGRILARKRRILARKRKILIASEEPHDYDTDYREGNGKVLLLRESFL